MDGCDENDTGAERGAKEKWNGREGGGGVAIKTNLFVAFHTTIGMMGCAKC